MWLVSDECAWVGWKIKRLWNSCQVRTVQNGLLTAFYISLHHSSWTLPLISSPTLTCVFSPSLFPLALSAAKKDTQGMAEVLRTGGPLQPDEAGQVPDRLSREHSENISCAGRWLQGSRKDHSDLDWKANDG